MSNPNELHPGDEVEVRLRGTVLENPDEDGDIFVELPNGYIWVPASACTKIEKEEHGKND